MKKNFWNFEKTFLFLRLIRFSTCCYKHCFSYWKSTSFFYFRCTVWVQGYQPPLEILSTAKFVKLGRGGSGLKISLNRFYYFGLMSMKHGTNFNKIRCIVCYKKKKIAKKSWFSSRLDPHSTVILSEYFQNIPLKSCNIARIFVELLERFLKYCTNLAMSAQNIINVMLLQYWYSILILL